MSNEEKAARAAIAIDLSEYRDTLIDNILKPYIAEKCNMTEYMKHYFILVCEKIDNV